MAWRTTKLSKWFVLKDSVHFTRLFYFSNLSQIDILIFTFIVCYSTPISRTLNAWTLSIVFIAVSYNTS